MHKINSFGLDKVAEIKLSFNQFFFGSDYVYTLHYSVYTYLIDDMFIFFVTEVIWLLYRYSDSDS